jgi:hypothetical protein
MKSAEVHEKLNKGRNAGACELSPWLAFWDVNSHISQSKEVLVLAGEDRSALIVVIGELQVINVKERKKATWND